ncbi:MAG: TonB-dependent receptor, partial [Bacteroidetes bacterium]|nr:TonB-dependent receptor [Bacteroidota bacterium]
MKHSYISKFIFAFILMLVTSSGSLFAQKFTVSGVVTDATVGDNLIGANVYIPDLAIGAATDANGEYSITVDKGTYNMTCSYIGYERVDMEVVVDSDVTLNFSLTDYQFTLSVTVIADRVKERETPVAYSTIDKKDMEFELGSRDIPIILNTTPSVFATNQGGGYGDARFNVRGFNQRNVAVLINGIPQNDMENGWVYWSNWDGVGDATSSIQMQRGLSAVNLATPSIGGTMNIITDPSQHKAGAFYKNEFGTGNFIKQSLFAHTGVIDGFALSVGGVRKVGDGSADRT